MGLKTPDNVLRASAASNTICSCARYINEKCITKGTIWDAAELHDGIRNKNGRRLVNVPIAQ
jgi:hypothetical protein